MNKHTSISLLKFASCLTNNRDIRSFCQNVFIEYDQGNTVIYSTNGHVAIRIIVDDEFIFGGHVGVAGLDGINNAYKTGLLDLVEIKVESDVRRPPLEKVFVENNNAPDDKVGLDVKYLSLITSSMVKLAKDLGTKQSGVVFHKINATGANFLSFDIDLRNEFSIKILVAIMPMKI